MSIVQGTSGSPAANRHNSYLQETAESHMKLKVIEAHVSDYPNPISFENGQEIRVGKRDTQYEGWVWVTTNDGNEGWAPEHIGFPGY